MRPRGAPRARVVLVEGFDDLRDVLAMSLAHAGFEVRAFAAAAEAFACVVREAPHVIVVGASSTELGDEFGRRLRGDERARRAARIAVTAQREGVLELGAIFHRVLLKPFDCDRLLAEVGRLAVGVPYD